MTAVDSAVILRAQRMNRDIAIWTRGVDREQFNPDLTGPDSVVEEWISVGTFRAKEKITAKPQQVVD